MVVRNIGAALLVLALTQSARADDAAYTPPDFMAKLPPLPPAVDAAKVWRLSLAEATQVALHQNLGIAIEREQVSVAELGVTVAKGPFEPLLTASYGHNRADRPPLNLTEGAPDRSVSDIADDWRVTLSDRLQTGTLLSLDFSNVRARSTSDAAVFPLVYGTTLTATVTQPLLRGMSPDLEIPRIDILRAKIASERERAQLVVTAADIVQRTENAYWDVVQALYTYDLQLRSQKRAEDQMALTRRQIDAGLMPPSDLIASETTLAQRKLQVLQAEAAIDATYDLLRSVLNLPRDQWARPILPVEPPQFVDAQGSADQALELAVKHRPELAQLDLDLKTALLAVHQAENNELPQLDLGLSGQIFGQDTTYGSTLGGVRDADNHAYAVTLNLSWTPLAIATRAQAEIERTHHTMAIVRRDQAVQDIWFAVRDAVRNQASAARQVLAASKFRQLSTESLEVEQRKFLSNQSSNFVLGQHQDEVAAAQLAELSAVLVHKKATAALLKATGTLLDQRHIALDVTPPAR